jgi:hypothetical protein
MSHHQHRHFLGVPAAGILLAGLALSSCGHKPPPPAGEATNASGANDQKIVDLMEKMRARALKAPGGAMEALDFAYNVTQLYIQGVTKRRPIAPTLIDEAVKCLDEARMAKPDDAADLLARKGEMLLAAEKNEAGVGALRGSMAERPNLRAFKPLIKHYAAIKSAAEAEALCKRALPAMKSDENRYIVLDECLKSTEATTPEAGLKWAGAKEVTFYKNRKRDLDARLAAAKQAKAKEEPAEAKKP